VANLVLVQVPDAACDQDAARQHVRLPVRVLYVQLVVIFEGVDKWRLTPASHFKKS
jgi:hypothetical protein